MDKIMQRRNFLKAAAAAAGTTLLASGVHAASDETKMRLRMQRYWGTETDHLHGALTKDVRELTDNNINITHFRSGALVPNDEMFSAVSKGTLDMAQGYGGYWNGQIDLGIIESGIPGAWASYAEAQYIWYKKGLLELAREAYAEKNVYFLMPVFTTPYELLTKKPVNSLEDLKSMKIRATATMAGVLAQFDVPTTYVPVEEIYVSLSTGVIDGVIYGSTNEYKNLKLHEVAKYYTRMKLTDPGSVDNIIINMDRWKAMSKRQQVALELSCKKMAYDLYNWGTAGTYDVQAEGLFNIGELSTEDSKLLTQAALKTWKTEADKSERNKKAIAIMTDVAKSMGRI